MTEEQAKALQKHIQAIVADPEAFVKWLASHASEPEWGFLDTFTKHEYRRQAEDKLAAYHTWCTSMKLDPASPVTLFLKGTVMNALIEHDENIDGNCNQIAELRSHILDLDRRLAAMEKTYNPALSDPAQKCAMTKV